MAQFALMAVVGLVPGLLVAPIAGAIIDRTSRRRVMLAADAAAFTIQLAFGMLLWTGNLSVAMIYPLLGCLSVALTFQRLAYFSAVPQLVPKRYLGHAVGIMQLSNGTAQLLVPIFAVGLLAGIGLGGILILDVASYAIAIVILLMVKFPATMPWRRRESIKAEILGGLRYSLGAPRLRRHAAVLRRAERVPVAAPADVLAAGALLRRARRRRPDLLPGRRRRRSRARSS